MINNIKKWFDYEPFQWRIKVSAGIVLILNSEKLLLCHPSNQSWEGTLSFPKGGLNKGESEVDAALRELKEETSISLSKDKIENIENPIVIDYVNKKGRNYKKVYLYIVRISDVSEVGLHDEVINKDNLQLEEIDWCGFLTKREAQQKIFHRVSHLLDLV